MIRHVRYSRTTEGFQRFRVKSFEPNRGCSTDWRCGDKPRTLLIGCSDSRVDRYSHRPAPGDLFVVRNVANLVPPYRNHRSLSRHQRRPSSSRFAIAGANVIVLGHSRCGGINALLEGYGRNDEGEGFIAPWVQIAAPLATKCCGVGPDASRPGNGLQTGRCAAFRPH